MFGNNGLFKIILFKVKDAIYIKNENLDFFYQTI